MDWPEKASSLYARVRAIIHGTIKDAATDEWGAKIGGGTAFALRHRHRESDDLDISVKTEATRAWWRRLSGEMKAAGATDETPVYEADEREPKVTAFIFGDGKVDVSTLPLRLPHGHRTVVVASDANTVLSDAQVLSGKYWGRGREAPTRDLYDYAVAGEVNRGALEVAVNGQARHFTERAIRNWWSRLDEHDAGRDNDEINGAPEQWRTHARNPIPGAVTAVMSCLYDRIELRLEQGILVVTTELPDRERTKPLETPEDVENWWLQTAQDRFWRAQGEDPDAVRQRVTAGMSKRESGRLIDFTPERVQPPRGFRAPRSGNKRPMREGPDTGRGQTGKRTIDR